jgi:hypothetical protein
MGATILQKPGQIGREEVANRKIFRLAGEIKALLHP